MLCIIGGAGSGRSALVAARYPDANGYQRNRAVWQV